MSAQPTIVIGEVIPGPAFDASEVIDLSVCNDSGAHEWILNDFYEYLLAHPMLVKTVFGPLKEGHVMRKGSEERNVLYELIKGSMQRFEDKYGKTDDFLFYANGAYKMRIREFIDCIKTAVKEAERVFAKCM